MDGYERRGASRRRRVGAHSDHRRHLLCARGRRAKTREAGCDGYIAKPSAARLLAKVREFVG